MRVIGLLDHVTYRRQAAGEVVPGWAAEADPGFAVSLLAGASVARRFLLRGVARPGIGGRWATNPAVVRTSDVDYAQSGAPGMPLETGGLASGAEPGRREAPALGGWLDAGVIFRQHHADLVRLAMLLVGDRACAEDVVQDVFTRLCAGGRELGQDSALAYVRAAVVNGCRSVLRRRALARRIAITRAVPWRDTQDSAEHTAILAEDRRRVLAALAARAARAGSGWRSCGPSTRLAAAAACWLAACCWRSPPGSHTSPRR